MQYLYMLKNTRAAERRRWGQKVKSTTVLLPIVGSASLNRVFIAVVVTILYTDAFLGNAT